MVGCVVLGNVETNAPINANFLVLAMRAILVVPIVQARVVVTVEAMLTVDMCVDILVDRGVLEIAVALLRLLVHPCKKKTRDQIPSLNFDFT